MHNLKEFSVHLPSQRIYMENSYISDYFKKRCRSFKYAWNGIVKLFRTEAHAKIHLTVGVIVIIVGFILHLSPIEWCIISLCIGGVFMAEGFNTAIEKLSDKISKEFSPLIGQAKDIAAGSVLLFVIAAVVSGLIIFIPKIF